MSSWKEYLPAMFFLVALAVVLNATERSGQPEPTHPQSFEDVIAIAKNLGLHCRGATKTAPLVCALSSPDLL